MSAAPVRRWPLTAVLTANAISATGRTLSLIGVPWFVLATTGSAGRAGVVAFCATLPVVVSALVGGPVIDRIGRRRVSIASDLLCALSVGAIPLLTDSTVALTVVMGAAGVAGGTINPILTTVTYERVPDELRSRVAGAMTAGCELTMPLGALAAGLLTETAGLSPALLLMGAVYLLVTLSPAVLPVWRDLDAVLRP